MGYKKTAQIRYCAMNKSIFSPFGCCRRMKKGENLNRRLQIWRNCFLYSEQLHSVVVDGARIHNRMILKNKESDDCVELHWNRKSHSKQIKATERIHGANALENHPMDSASNSINSTGRVNRCSR